MMSLSAHANNTKISHAEIHLDYLISQSRMFMQRYLNSCIDDEKRCGLDNAEYTVLKRIFKILPDNFSDLKVVTMWEHEANGKFGIGAGAHRLAVTSFHRNATIYINKNLAINKETGNVLSQADIISILVHEHGHHAGILDTDDRILDRISNAVKKRYLSLSEQINLGSIGLPNIRFSIHNMLPFKNLRSYHNRLYRGLNVLNLNGNSGMTTYLYLVNNSQTSGTNSGANVVLKQLVSLYPKKCQTETYIQAIFVNNLRWRLLPDARDLLGRKITAQVDAKVLCGRTLETAELIETDYIITSNTIEVDGHIVLDSSTQKRFVVGDIDNFDNDHSKGVKITDLKMNTSEINEGGNWSGHAKLTLTKDVETQRCWLDFTSKNFITASSVIGTVSHIIYDCQIISKVGEKIEVKFNYPVDKTTISSDIYIQNIYIKTKNYTANIVPQFRPRLKIRNTNDESKFELENVEFFDEFNQAQGPISSYLVIPYTKKMRLKLTFNSCHQSGDIENIYFKMVALKADNSQLGSLDYPFSTLDRIDQLAPIISNDCVNGKRELYVEFEYSFVNADGVSDFISYGIKYFVIQSMFFNSSDHRNYVYKMENFVIQIQ